MKRIALLELAFLGLTLAPTAAPQATAAKKTPANDPDMKEIKEYRLSIEGIQKYVAAFKALVADTSAVCLKEAPPGNAKTLAEGEKILAGCGHAAADISGAGLKPREFLVITGTLMGDIMAVGMKRQGIIKEYPEIVSAENANFVEQNFDKIQALLAPLMPDKKPQ